MCFFNPFLYKSSVRVFDRLSFVIHSRGGCQGLCFLRYSTVDFKVCLGSLSCCRSHPLSYYSIYTDGLVFACRICWYFIESILLSTTEMFPVPLAETQAKSMIDLSPCLAVATVVHFFLMKSCTKQPCLLQPQNDFFLKLFQSTELVSKMLV